MSIKISVYDGFSISGIAYVHVVACVFCFWNNHYISTNIQTAGQFRSGAEFHLLYSWNKGTNSLVQSSSATKICGRVIEYPVITLLLRFVLLSRERTFLGLLMVTVFLRKWYICSNIKVLWGLKLWNKFLELISLTDFLLPFLCTDIKLVSTMRKSLLRWTFGRCSCSGSISTANFFFDEPNFTTCLIHRNRNIFLPFAHLGSVPDTFFA